MKTSGMLFILILALAACRATDGRIVNVEAVDYQEKVIYHSPETPGFTAWVGLWRINDKKIFCDFRQLTGPKDNPKSAQPLLESNDEGKTWKVVPLQPPAEGSGRNDGIFQTGRESCRGMAVLDRGKTLVRPVWPADYQKDTGYLVRSTDGGKTWSRRIDIVPNDTWCAWPTNIRKLRDGRLVLMAGCWKRGEKIPWLGEGPMRKMMFISSDKGKTWSTPIPLLTPEQGVCEESDFVEWPNGDLFWVHRSEFYPENKLDVLPPGACLMGASHFYTIRNQSITRKQGDTFVPESPTLADIPHSGYPLLIQTKEGVILHLGTDGIRWTADVGKTWHRLDIPGTPYYPKGFQFTDETIIVVGHIGGDDVYGAVDQAIKQQTFKLKITRE